MTPSATPAPHSGELTTLSSKGQLVIPKALRDSAQWAAGDALEVLLSGGEMRLRRVVALPQAHALDAVAGCLRRPSQPVLTEAQIKARIGQRLKARLA